MGTTETSRRIDSALTPRPLFDVILSSPPSFAGEPRDVADRAWHAGPSYRDIAMLFIQARERLASGGWPRSATVIADDDLICYSLSKDDFAALANESPAVAIKLLASLGRELSGRLRVANRIIHELEL
jgi:CRP-like cAMP-binding protein